MAERTLIVAANPEGAPVRVLRDIITTPGTRLSWSTPLEWMAHDCALQLRRHSAGRYKAEEAHLEALAGAGTWFLSQDLEQLVALDGYVRLNLRGRTRLQPVRGRRAGSPYVRIINELDATIAQKRQGKL